MVALGSAAGLENVGGHVGPGAPVLRVRVLHQTGIVLLGAGYR